MSLTTQKFIFLQRFVILMLEWMQGRSRSWSRHGICSFLAENGGVIGQGKTTSKKKVTKNSILGCDVTGNFATFFCAELTQRVSEQTTSIDRKFWCVDRWLTRENVCGCRRLPSVNNEQRACYLRLSFGCEIPIRCQREQRASPFWHRLPVPQGSHFCEGTAGDGEDLKGSETFQRAAGYGCLNKP